MYECFEKYVIKSNLAYFIYQENKNNLLDCFSVFIVDINSGHVEK